MSAAAAQPSAGSMPTRAVAGVHVEVVGHATLRIHSGGKTLLMDPWLRDSIGAGSCFHFPPLVHDLADLAAHTDAIHVSHAHPDHFHPRTLGAFPRHVPIYIGRYRDPGLRDAVRALGFAVVEVPFGETVPIEGTPFEITPIEHDVAAAGTDSASVVRTPEFTLFENNDCLLRPETYRRLRERFAIDYAFLGYSPASAYPIHFEMPVEEKERLLRAAAERRLASFLEAARLLSPRLAVPYANGMRFLDERALWKNAAFGSPGEAVRRLREVATGIPGEVMCPGDRIVAGGGIDRGGRRCPRDPDEERAAIAAYAAAQRGRVAEAVCGRTPPAADVVERFRAHVLACWRAQRARRPDVLRHVVAYEVQGTACASFHFDFRRADDDVFGRGVPDAYDMRLRVPAWTLQMALDGDIAWEEVDFAEGVSIHQVSWAPDFCAMLAGAA